MLKYMPLIGYLMLGVNLAALILFGVDKLLALRKRRRIPELVLLAGCFFGGSLGGLLGMVLFRHKINCRRHPAFVVGVPVMLVLQLTALFFLVWRWG